MKLTTLQGFTDEAMKRMAALKPAGSYKGFELSVVEQGNMHEGFAYKVYGDGTYESKSSDFHIESGWHETKAQAIIEAKKIIDTKKLSSINKGLAKSKSQIKAGEIVMPTENTKAKVLWVQGNVVNVEFTTSGDMYKKGDRMEFEIDDLYYVSS